MSILEKVNLSYESILNQESFIKNKMENLEIIFFLQTKRVLVNPNPNHQSKPCSQDFLQVRKCLNRAHFVQFHFVMCQSWV